MASLSLMQPVPCWLFCAQPHRPKPGSWHTPFTCCGFQTKTCKAMPSPETSKGTVRQSRLSAKRVVLKSKCYGTGGKSSSHQPLAHELSTPLLSPRYLEHAFIPTALSNPTNLTISNFSSQLLPSIFWRILKKRHFPRSSAFSAAQEVLAWRIIAWLTPMRNAMREHK